MGIEGPAPGIEAMLLGPEGEEVLEGPECDYEEEEEEDYVDDVADGGKDVDYVDVDQALAIITSYLGK